MADYKRMYIELYKKVTEVIGALQEIQRATEDIYIDSANEDNTVNREITDEEADKFIREISSALKKNN